MAWIVKLVKEPPEFYLWKKEYFPRTFTYKTDAIRLVNAVKEMGGEASLTKLKK